MLNIDLSTFKLSDGQPVFLLGSGIYADGDSIKINNKFYAPKVTMRVPDESKFNQIYYSIKDGVLVSKSSSNPSIPQTREWEYTALDFYLKTNNITTSVGAQVKLDSLMSASLVTTIGGQTLSFQDQAGKSVISPLVFDTPGTYIFTVTSNIDLFAGGSLLVEKLVKPSAKFTVTVK